MESSCEETASPRPGSAFRRGLRRVLLGLILAPLAVELAWVVLANAFLGSPVADWALEERPKRWGVSWKRAWTWIPARFEARGLVYRQTGRRVDFEVRADRVRGSLSLAALKQGEISLDDVEAGSVEIDVVRRPAREGEQGQSLPGQPRPPGLLFSLRDLRVARLARFSVDDLVLTGHGRLGGTLTRQVRGDLWIPELEIDWPGAQAVVGDDAVTRSLDLSFSGGFQRFDPRVDRGRRSLAHLYGRLEVDGYLANLTPLQLFLAETSAVQDLGGRGDVAVRADLREGRLLPGSVIEVRDAELEVEILSLRSRGVGQVDIASRLADEGRRSEVDIRFDRYDLSFEDEEKSFAEGRGLRLLAEADEISIVGRPEGLSLDLEMPGARITDLSVFSRFTPEGLGLDITGGSARTDLEVRVRSAQEGSGEDGRLEAEIRVDAEGLAGTFRDTDFRSDLRLVVPLTQRDWAEGVEVARDEGGSRERRSTVFQVEDAEIRFSKGLFDDHHKPPEPGWWMDVAIPRGAVDLGPVFRLEGELDLAMRDSRAVVMLYAETKQWLRHLGGLLTVRDVRGTADLTLANREMTLRNVDLSGERFAAEGELDLADDRSNGIFWCRLRRLSAGFQRQGEESEVKLIGPRKWFDEQREVHWPSTTR